MGLELQCLACRNQFEIPPKQKGGGQVKCPYCSMIVTIPPARTSHLPTMTRDLLPVDRRSTGHPAGNARASGDDAQLPAVAPPIEKRSPVQKKVVPPPVVTHKQAGMKNTTRAQTLAHDSQSKQHWKKNLVAWSICTLILSVVVFLLVHLIR